MKRQKIKNLISLVKKNLRIAETVAKSSRSAAHEVAGVLVASYSAAGDVEHAKNAADLNEAKVNKTKLFLQELEEAVLLPVPQTIQPVCSFSILLEATVPPSGTTGLKDFILVNNPIYLEGLNIISANSPIGNAVLGKSVGDTFSYEAGTSQTSGVVVSIE